MIQSTPEQVLYRLEWFGIPRHRYLTEAARMVDAGELAQEDVDVACHEYEERIKAANLRKYGTPNPTDEEVIAYSFKLLDEGRKVLEKIDRPKNHVEMWDGKYTISQVETSGIEGCVVTLIYDGGGILTHYPPIDILSDNFDKLKELKLNMEKEKPKFGVILAPSALDLNLYESLLKVLFPGINLSVERYDFKIKGKVTLDAKLGEWEMEGERRSFVK